MKTLVLALLLAITPLVAQETTNQPPFNVVVIVLTSTNQLSMVLQAITNAVPSAVIIQKIRSPKATQMEIRIKLMEARFKENYGGFPTTYIGNGTPESSATLNKYIVVWKQKEIDAIEIKAQKDELQKMQ